MFKIKVGLKSFQTHSIQKCKYQIGQIVYYLKQSSDSFQSTSASPTMHLVHRAHFAKQDAEQNSVFYKGKIESMGEKKPTLVRDLFGVTPLPTLIKKMTTLRSPHIDKKSREQFEWKREKTQIHFHLTSVPQVSLVLFILMHSRFPGVELEIGVESKTYFA